MPKKRRGPQRFASPAEVVQQAQEWPDGYLYCRVYKHDDRPRTLREHPKERIYKTVHVCARCGSTLFQEISTVTGLRLNSWRVLPDDYGSRNGRVAGAARGALRLAVVTRVFKVVEAKPSDPLPSPKALRVLEEGRTDGA